MDEHAAANRRLWNEWTAIHERSAFYDVEGFKAGRITLHPIEIEELGDVAGKRLLHMQCHFGQDTMSWARLGATVTGADFSDRAISLARSLADEINIPARFVCSDVLQLDEALDERFDVVYTGGGAIYWLSDLNQWAKVIAHFLEPGGVFYIREFHPFAFLFHDDELRLHYPYFDPGHPLEIPVHGSYAERDAAVSQAVEYSWVHSLQDIFDALIGAGLRIRFFHEFDFTREKLFSWTEQGADGLWRVEDAAIPLMFSIRATKD